LLCFRDFYAALIGFISKFEQKKAPVRKLFRFILK
jgi:hypothetical protein